MSYNEVELRYRVKGEIPEDCSEFWYVDLKDCIGDNNFILIEEFFISKDIRNNGFGTELLKLFTSQFGEETIILAKSGLLYKEFPEEPSDETFNEVLTRLDRFYTNRSFLNINTFSKTYEFRELYVFDNEIGREFYNKVKEFYLNQL